MQTMQCSNGVRPPCGVRSQRDLTPQGGFTLTELLISLVLGAFVIGGVLSVFLGGLETFRMTDSLSRMQESGRFALELMRRDLREAGFVGCRNTLRQENPRSEGALDPGLIRNTLNPTPSGATDPLAFEFDFGVPLMGYDADGAGGWIAGDPLAPAPQDTSVITNPDPDSDIVVMIAARGAGLTVSAHPGMPSQPGSATIQLATDSDLEPGDIVFATDCLSGSIFQITNANFKSDNLPHNTGTGTPGNFTQELGRSFVGAEVFRIERAAYYVANVPTPQRPDRLVLLRNGDEIAENVEQLQVSYGLDDNSDTAVNQYVTAKDMFDNGYPWDNVLAIRLDLLLSSGEEDNLTEEPVSLTYNGDTFTAADNRLYRVFTATVGVRNRVP